NCAIALTHHKRARKMQCHYCGYTAPVPQHCIHCGSEYVYFLGTGSEKLEELLHGLFPEARIGRLDRDTVRGRDDFERLLAGMDAGEIDLLVGTQMIAKGHDIHNVTLVGVVGADMALGMPDFRAAERTFQLLTQVAGRAGRGGTHGKVVLRTYFPDHAAEARLSPSLYLEVREPGKTKYAFTNHARLCGAAKNSAHPGDCRCRRAMADVMASLLRTRIASAWLRQHRDSPQTVRPAKDPLVCP